MPINFKIKENWGTEFYLKTDPEQIPRPLMGIYLGPGHVIYKLRAGLEVLEAYDFELSTEPDEVKRLSFKEHE